MNYRTFLSAKLNRVTLWHIGHSKFNQDVFWNFGSLGILALGGIIFNLVIAKFRGSEALGIFNQVFAIYLVLSQIGVGGLKFSVLNHISHNQDNRAKCADITIAALILVVIVSGLIGLGCYFLANLVGTLLQSPGVSVGLLLIIPGLFFFTLNKVLINALNGLRYMRAYAIFRALRFILIPVSILAIIFWGLSDPYLALSLTITELLLFIGLIIYVNVRLFPLKMSPNIWGWFPEHLSFGVRGVLSGILIELNTRVDILMLGYFSTDVVVGIYSFAAILAEGFSQFPLVLRWNIDPIIGRYFAEGQQGRINEIARKIKQVFYPIMGLIGLTVILLYPLLFKLWIPGAAIVVSWAVFAIIMAGVVINSGYRPFIGLMLQGGRPGSYTLVISALVMSNVVLNAGLIPIMGIYGAAVATAIVYVLEAVLLIVSAKKLFGVRL